MPNKIALCFIINYDHILSKEHLWREWIEPNQDIINVYFFYKDIRKIKSPWILKHTLPPSFLHHTSYYYVMPAYLSLLKFALGHDKDDAWFCMLTDTCCPIISPKRFRYLFLKHQHQSIITCKPAWWNPHFHSRANLAKLPKEWWLANDPWFVLTREHAQQSIAFIARQPKLVDVVCSGGLANESYFAMVLKNFGQLNRPNLISASTHITDWDRRSSATSPHVFKEADERDIVFLDEELERNSYAMFVRKVAPEFPDEVLRHYMYEQFKERDDALELPKSSTASQALLRVASLRALCSKKLTAWWTWLLTLWLQVVAFVLSACYKGVASCRSSKTGL